jgi:hypothetical protein
VNILLEVKENDEHALDFALHLSRLFGHGELGLSVYGSRFLQDLMYIRCRIQCEIASGHTQFQIKGRKNQHVHPAV